MAQIYEAHQWLKLLYSKGWTTFYHEDLPGYLQRRYLMNTAGRCRLCKPTGNRRVMGSTHLKEWRIPDDIMTISVNMLRYD